ncbi:MAG: DoxX family protein [Xanthomonadales bacterium]|jgi:putative oxidoreductase|nr:DoxX family protein [Xanthomonadales bacterium]
MKHVQDLAAPIGRILLALMFVVAGLNKISGYSGMQGYMDSMGVPGALLPLVIVLEVAGGLLLMLGWHTRLTAFLLAGFTLLATLIFHSNLGDQTQMLFFMKNLSIAGGLLLVVSHGAGAYSIDNRQRS